MVAVEAGEAEGVASPVVGVEEEAEEEALVEVVAGEEGDGEGAEEGHIETRRPSTIDQDTYATAPYVGPLNRGIKSLQSL